MSLARSTVGVKSKHTLPVVRSLMLRGRLASQELKERVDALLALLEMKEAAGF